MERGASKHHPRIFRGSIHPRNLEVVDQKQELLLLGLLKEGLQKQVLKRVFLHLWESEFACLVDHFQFLVQN